MISPSIDAKSDSDIMPAQDTQKKITGNGDNEKSERESSVVTACSPRTAEAAG